MDLPSVAGRLAGRTAVVTGAGGTGAVAGIGRAIAELFARAGAAVVVVDRDERAAAATCAAIAAAGGRAEIAVADVARDADCARAVAVAVTLSGGIDVLVNNVGIASTPAAVADVDEADWARVLDVNAGSVLRMSRHALPVMGRGGAVVNVSSAAVGRPGLGTAYSASKSAVEALTRATAVQYGPRGIRANCVSPGALWTDMVARLYAAEGTTDEKRAARRAAAALDAEGTAWDAAYAALFLASAESGFVTGQVLAVDGGAPLR